MQMLKADFVPVAIDQAYQRRQKDTEGEFYRKIAGQGPRSDFQGTTQGFYIATSTGKLLLYNNNRHPEKVRRLMQEKLREFRSGDDTTASPQQITAVSRDPRYNVQPPGDGMVVRVRAKVLGGYDETSDRWQQIFQTSISRDNLWITGEEQSALAGGQMPQQLARRIARYHLVDNTRGEPPMWRENEIRELTVSLEDGNLTGSVHLQTKDGRRGYQAKLKGVVESAEGKVTRMDIVCLGEFWGEGPYTRRAPKGKFPLAIVFELADGSDVADQIPPQGSRGWVPGYLR